MLPNRGIPNSDGSEYGRRQRDAQVRSIRAHRGQRVLSVEVGDPEMTDPWVGEDGVQLVGASELWCGVRRTPQRPQVCGQSTGLKEDPAPPVSAQMLALSPQHPPQRARRRGFQEKDVEVREFVEEPADALADGEEREIRTEDDDPLDQRR